ncbi:MAG TPA: glycoside hydrolase family 66 protein, partial [Symbiobacteriaceae bacterium]|nr:glycoside hydrolase family 66 protein [Symbiobacteriaceae bacterium]
MWPDKAQYRPGERVLLHAPGAGKVRIFELGHAVVEVAVAGELGEVVWTAPEAGEHSARGFYAEALDERGAVLATTAFDVARHWSVAPRYGFLCNFKPGETAAEAVAGLNRLHINAVQYYDWMYTHYQFFAETDEFTDPLGRPSSHAVVRAKIEACHRYGIACLAYGAVYGGEQPIADAHPEWLLCDGNEQPYKFGWWGSHLQNFDHGCGWREHLLGEFAGAIRRLDFDGMHIDSYGYPKRGVWLPEPGRKEIVDLTRALPEFVAEAALQVKRLKPDGGTSFNCVNTWPVELMARRTEDQV